MQARAANGDVFESGCEFVDVTMLHRPDTNWRYVDKHGHEHRWYVEGQPVTIYRPQNQHQTPTLKWVFEEWGYYEDGERYQIGHHECVDCGEHIEPRYTADDTKQMIPGLRWYQINGQSVSREEFERRATEAFTKLDH